MEHSNNHSSIYKISWKTSMKCWVIEDLFPVWIVNINTTYNGEKMIYTLNAWITEYMKYWIKLLYLIILKKFLVSSVINGIRYSKLGREIT